MQNPLALTDPFGLDIKDDLKDELRNRIIKKGLDEIIRLGPEKWGELCPVTCSQYQAGNLGGGAYGNVFMFDHCKYFPIILGTP